MTAIGRRLRPLGLLLLAFSLPLVSGAGAAGTATELAEAFCKTRTTGDAEAVKPLLTPSLLAVIAEAEDRNRIIAESTPDEKPPFGDGIPYQSFSPTSLTPASREKRPSGQDARKCRSSMASSKAPMRAGPIH